MIQEKFPRRTFLKAGGWAIIGTLLTACGIRTDEPEIPPYPTEIFPTPETAFIPTPTLIPPTAEVIPTPQALTNYTETGTLPSLPEFINQVKNDKPNRAAGLFAPDYFALPVVQQPEDNNKFIHPYYITQFSVPQDNVIGLLAKITGIGGEFLELNLNDKAVVVKGNGATVEFTINNITKVRALNPYNPYGNFELLDGQILTARETFIMFYTNNDPIRTKLTLQTCGLENGSPIWRIFWEAVF